MIKALLALVLAVATGVTAARAEVAFDRLQRADGARVVPERFLRSWDPVTLFFDRDIGPANGGPEDAPERTVTLTPVAPGAWQWLGPRALQFRPAEAWKPLQPVEIAADGVRTRLLPLLPMPVSASPSDQSDGIADLDRIALTFDEPVALEALARLISIEIRPARSPPAAAASRLPPAGTAGPVARATARRRAPPASR